MRLKAAIEEFLNFKQSQSTKVAWKRYAYVLDPFCAITRNIELQDRKGRDRIGVREVEAYMAWCATVRGNTRNTIRTNVGLLSGFFRWAKRRRYVEKNPTDDVERPKWIPPAAPRTFTQDEWERLEAAHERASPYKHSQTNAWGLTALSRYFGMRKGGAIGLKQKDVDLSARRLKVVEKGQKPRVLPIPKRALPALKACLKQSAEMGSDYLLCSRTGGQIGQAAFHRLWKRALEAARLPSVRYHNGRHSFASYAVRKGVNVKALQVMLGHKHLSTTAAYLADLGLSDMLPEEMRKMYPEEEGEKDNKLLSSGTDGGSDSEVSRQASYDADFE